jgi:hypothetical protein
MKMFTFGHAIEDAITTPPATVTYQQADAVAKGLAAKYQKADWLYGVGIIPSDKDGFRVEVRTDPRANIPTFPRRINGVCVSVKKTSVPVAVVGIDSLDSDLMNFKRNPISWRAEIGGAHLMGEKREESLKGV